MWAAISGALGTVEFFAVLVGLIVGVLLVHSSNRRGAEAASDLKFEGALQHVISRPKTGESTWTAPHLPASVIAAIWTHRFVGHPTKPSTQTQGYESSLQLVTWDFGREAPYIIATALLSLRDGGFIKMYLEPRGKFLDPLTRVWVERTELPLPDAEMPAVEGGLLLACMDLAHKRFGKTDQPSVAALTKEWMGAQSHPFKWVLDSATYQGRELGLYEPTVRKREKHPVFSMEHLAACEDQVMACVNRWEQFGVDETDLQQRLLTEVSFGIRATSSGGAG